MVWTFEADDDGAYVAELDAAELAVLAELVDEVVGLLGGEPQPTAFAAEPEHPLDALHLGADPVTAPVDPALRRLLPDGSHDDAAAAEFRRLTEADLRVTKVSQLLRLRAALVRGISAAEPAEPAEPAETEGDVSAGEVAASGELTVTAEEAPDVAAALTDLRLVLAERMGVRTDGDAQALQAMVLELDPAQPQDETERTAVFLVTVSSILGLLQESLVELMLAELPDGGRARRRDSSGQ